MEQGNGPPMVQTVKKRSYTPRGTRQPNVKRSKSEIRLTVPKVKGSTGISGRCRSDGSMIVKGNWTDEEDERLIDLVHHNLDLERDPRGIASTRWSEIAKELPGRVGKQCRERWHNHLRPDINKGRWTFLEEITIYLCWRTWNSQWARISRILEGRSDNRVKNHWNCHMKRRLQRDDTYFQFMENCHETISPTVEFNRVQEDDFEDGLFRGALFPKIEHFLAEHKSELDRLPFFSTGSKRTSGEMVAPLTSFARTTFPSMASLLQSPAISATKRVAKEPKEKVKRPRREKTTATQVKTEPRHAPTWLSFSPQRDYDEENNYISRGLMGSPADYYSRYGAMSQESYLSEVKVEAPSGSGMVGSPGGGYFYSQDAFRSPVLACPEGFLEENGAQPALYGDPLWSRAVSSDFSVGSPTYFHRSGAATVTSTPLKASSSFNVPSATECGANSLLSPYLGLRQFPGFYSGEDVLLSPIRRSFCGESSRVEETFWSPAKTAGQVRWTPIKLGSIVNIVKTPQAIREALASSEMNRSRISPEDLASPSRLFSDASELIDGEMNSHRRNSFIQTSTPEPVVKCRRRLTDQWSSCGTPSLASTSGYGTFHTTPGGYL